MKNLDQVNFKKFEDEFGNLKNEFEVIQYEKYSDGQWVEVKRFESGRGHYILDDQLYFRLDYTLIPLNMDFNSETCGACYKIGKTIENKKKITGNEILFICKFNFNNNNNTLSLHKQSYSNGTCFYTLQDNAGNWKVKYGNEEISELIKQIEYELKINIQHEKQFEDYPELVQEIHKAHKEWYRDILYNLKQIA